MSKPMKITKVTLQYVRPEVCLVGGISGAKKIAALAETRHVGVVPHNPLSPVSTAACLQIAACIPKDDGKGFLLIPDTPGIGVELKPDAIQKCPMRPREVVARLHVDGCVVDQ